METHLQNTIFPELENGRPNWDKPHTEAVVHHMRGIIRNAGDDNLDAQVLIIAAYAHDWGYSGLFNHGKALDLDMVKEQKQLHMEIGAAKTADLLKSQIFSVLSKQQKERIIHLISVHDKVKELKDVDELTLMEADTLGGLDVTRVKPSFSPESNERYMAGLKTDRISRFIHEYSVEKAEELYQLRRQYYKENF